MSKTIVALYQDLEQARAAVDALSAASFAQEAISLVVPDPDKEHSRILARRREAGDEESARSGAAEGALAGGALGALAGLLLA